MSPGQDAVLSAPPVDSSSMTGFTDLEEMITELPKAMDEVQRENNLKLVAELGKPAYIIEVLKYILADDERMTGIAGRSYRHSNHFDKIVLIDSGVTDSYRLTLHLWIPPYTEYELMHGEHIHSHRFSFWSSILTGRLTSEHYAVSETGENYNQFRYVPEKKGLSTHTNFYELVRETQLDFSGTTVKVKGDSYYLQYDRIHRVMLPEEVMGCTLVLRGPRERNFSDLYYNTGYPSEDLQGKNIMFSTEQLREKLERLVSAIEGEPASAD